MENTPLQTLLDERAKEFDETIDDLTHAVQMEHMGNQSYEWCQRQATKTFLQESILKGVRLGLAMGKDVLKEQKQWVFTTPYGLEITDDEYIKFNEARAALEAKEKELTN